MSVATRLLRRHDSLHFSRLVRSFAGKETGSRYRLFFSTHAKSPPESNAPKAEGKPDSVTPPPKTQAPVAKSPPPGAPPKPPSTPAAPVQKTQTLQGGVKPVAKSQPISPPKPTSTLPSTGTHKVPVQQKPVSSGGPAAAGAAASAGYKVSGAQATPGGASSGSTPRGQPSKLKVLLASGVVGSLVLGLLYWQTPKIHNGPTETGGGKGGGANLSGEEKPAKLVSEVVRDGMSGNEEEAVVKIELEPESSKVETEPADSGGFQPEVEVQVEKPAEDEQSLEPEERQPEVQSQADITADQENVVVRSEPEMEKVVIIKFRGAEDDHSEAHQADDTAASVMKKVTEVSESFLLQKGHEDLVKKHEEGNVVAVVTDETNKAQPVSGLDVVAAIHAAEQRQAETDAAVFKEQLHQLEERHDDEIKHAEQKLSQFREQIMRLQEGLEKEKLSYEARLKLQMEEGDVKLQKEIKLMEEANEQRLEETHLHALSEAATAIIEERVRFLNDIGSVKVHMEAMNAALDAKSEEAREGHEIKQLSLGSFALEEALITGAPVQTEAEILFKAAGGDPLVEVALKSLPYQVLEEGTLTPAELQAKMEEIEGKLRELAMIPASGGGVLCHFIARLAAALKIPEHAVHEDGGVESVLSQVQAHLRDGALLDAAETMTKGLSGTSAEKLAEDWASQARNRAILEQACALLRAHAAALALGDFSS